MSFHVELYQGVQVFVGGFGVAHVELHRLADAHPLRDRQRPGGAVQAEHVAHQEIAAPEVAPVLVQHPADVQALLEQALLVLRQRFPKLFQQLHGRFAAQLENDVVLGLRDNHVLADGPAALRHDRPQSHRPLQQHAGAALVAYGIVAEQSALARPADAARHTAQHWHAGVAVVHLLQKEINRQGERVTEQQHRRLAGARLHKCVGPTEQADAFRSPFEDQVKRFQLDRARPLGRPQAEGRTALDLPFVADDGLADAAEQAARRQAFLDPSPDGLRRARVMH